MKNDIEYHDIKLHGRHVEKLHDYPSKGYTSCYRSTTSSTTGTSYLSHRTTVAEPIRPLQQSCRCCVPLNRHHQVLQMRQ